MFPAFSVSREERSMDHYTHPPCPLLLSVFDWKSFCLPSTLPSRYTQPQIEMPGPHHTGVGVGGWGCRSCFEGSFVTACALCRFSQCLGFEQQGTQDTIPDWLFKESHGSSGGSKMKTQRHDLKSPSLQRETCFLLSLLILNT